MGELRELSLFSGYGGLSLGLRLANLNVRTVAYVEWDRYPQEVLKARIRDGFLDDAPIWGDISTFRGEQFRGLVQIISAGFPCPPFSVAGLGRGADDKRNLWPETLRVIREVRPSIVILENVPGILTASRKRGTPSYGAVVVGELAEEGYVVRWETLGADDVGAPHRRKRWLCIGVLADSRCDPEGSSAGSEQGIRGRPQRCSLYLAAPSSGRHRESDEEVRTRGNSTEHGNRDVADSDSDRTEWHQSRHRHWGWSEQGSQELADSRRNQYRGRETLRGTQGEVGEAERTHEESSGRGESPSRFWPEREPGDGSTAKQLDDPQHIRLADAQVSGSLGSRVHTQEGEIQPEQPTGSGGGATGGQELADSDRGRFEQRQPEAEPQTWLGEQGERNDTELADSDCQRGCGRATHWQDAEDAGQPPETQGRYGNHPIWPPRPDDTEGWIAVLNERPDLAPALTKDALATICGVADGPTHRVDRLKALGNGVVPAVAAAFLRRVGITSERSKR